MFRRFRSKVSPKSPSPRKPLSDRSALVNDDEAGNENQGAVSATTKDCLSMKGAASAEEIVCLPPSPSVHSSCPDDSLVPFSSPPSAPPKDTPVAAGKGTAICRTLVEPHVMSFLRWPEIGLLHNLSSGMRLLCEDENDETAPALWRSCCLSLGAEAGLYVPDVPPALYGQEKEYGAMAWKRFFFDGLWPARHRWGGSGALQDGTLVEEQSKTASDKADDFKVTVCIRFRPCVETPTDSKLSLPLHQYIKLQRQQARKKKGAEQEQGDAEKENGSSNRITVGSRPPSHFLDGVFGNLLKDPVKLPRSGAVVERSAALAHLRRSKTDLLDGSPMPRGASALVEMPELKAEIAAWHLERAEKDKDLDRVKRSTIVKDLVEGDGNGNLPPEVLEALLEAERLESMSKTAEDAAALDSKAKAQRKAQRLLNGDGDGEEDDDDGDGDDGRTDGDGIDDDGDAESDEKAPQASASELTGGLEDAESYVKQVEQQLGCPDDEEGGRVGALHAHGRGDGPRLLGTQPSRVVMFVPGQGVRPFLFSRVFAGESEQARIYDQCARPAVVSALNGFNACIMCYGQTGSGKTHTAFGPPGALEGSIAVRGESGLVVRVIDEVLQGAAALSSASVPTELANQQELAGGGGGGGGGMIIGGTGGGGSDPSAATAAHDPATVATHLYAQYVEIYNDQCTDLLTGEACDVRRKGGSLAGAVECRVGSLEEGLRLLRAGQVRKRFAATAMNERSSRAHTVFVLHVRQTRGDAMVSSTLHMVDLAGSERIKKSKAVGARRREAVGINESLLVLGKVISALVEGKSHVPYLECKLTTLLKGALGGASRTTAVVCCRQDDNQAEETLQALRFGERCALVSNVKQTVAASSASEALRSIDATLTQCENSLENLRRRKKQDLPAFKALQDRIQQLSQRRRAIADVARFEERQKAKKMEIEVGGR